MDKFAAQHSSSKHGVLDKRAAKHSSLAISCGICLQGRIGILEVHSRDKALEDNVDFQKVARATAGFTGAELMNLMNTAAVEAVRQGRDRVTEPDIFEVWCSLYLMCIPDCVWHLPCMRHSAVMSRVMLQQGHKHNTILTFKHSFTVLV